MPRFEAKARRTPRSRRSTVRIVDRRSPSRTALISLLVTGAAAVLLIVVWRFWRTDVPASAVQRQIWEVTLDWRCEALHPFRDVGAVGARPCPRCGRPAYPIGTWSCEDHGDIEAAVRFQTDESGQWTPSEYRLDGTEWGEAVEVLRCPKCDSELRRKREDPLENLPRPRKRRLPGKRRGG